MTGADEVKRLRLPPAWLWWWYAWCFPEWTRRVACVLDKRRDHRICRQLMRLMPDVIAATPIETPFVAFAGGFNDGKRRKR